MPKRISYSNRADRFTLNFSWLLKLRWVAIVGQLLTILFVLFVLKIAVATGLLAIVLLVTAGSNLVLTWWFRDWLRSTQKTAAENPKAAAISDGDKDEEAWPGKIMPGLVMTLDMLSLTTLLYSTGGVNNPFTFFFFVNLSLSAHVVGRSWAWALNVLTIGCFAFLIYDHIPIPELNLSFSVRQTGAPTLVQLGALAAFATCSSVIVYFMTRLTDELKLQQRDLRLAAAKQAQSEKLEALGTLAAGAAHELATPLSTIAIVAKEVEQQIDSGRSKSETLDDVRLIRGELDRCRKILDQMSVDAGQATGESISSVTVNTLIDEILDGLSLITGIPNEQSLEVFVDDQIRDRRLAVPVKILAQAIRGLVKNGVDATMHSIDVEAETNERESTSSGGSKVNAWSIAESFTPLHIRVEHAEQNDTLRIAIRDFGIGMSEDVLRRMSDPFFTTKSVGRGMGLGVFLANSVVQRLEGSIVFDSIIGEGTTAIVKLPLDTNDTVLNSKKSVGGKS